MIRRCKLSKCLPKGDNSMELKDKKYKDSLLIRKVFRIRRHYTMIQINRALQNSKINVELEGLCVSCDNDKICEKLVKGEISNKEATRLILLSHGIR